MTWFRFDTCAYEHDKVETVGNAAFGAWVRIRCWAEEFDTAADVPDLVARRFAKPGDVRRLVDAGLLVPTDRGFAIPDGVIDLPDGANRSEIDSHTARVVRRRDAGACRYCGTTAGEMHLDHVIPSQRHGVGSPRNVVLACRACNLSKGARTPREAGMVLMPVPKRGVS